MLADLMLLTAISTGACAADRMRIEVDTRLAQAMRDAANPELSVWQIIVDGTSVGRMSAGWRLASSLEIPGIAARTWIDRSADRQIFSIAGDPLVHAHLRTGDTWMAIEAPPGTDIDAVIRLAAGPATAAPHVRPGTP